MFLIPATSTAWRIARAIGWVLLAVACSVVVDLAIAGLFTPAPGFNACPCDLCVSEMRGFLPKQNTFNRAALNGGLIALAFALLPMALLATLDHAHGQGRPQPIPTPADQRLELLGGNFPRGACITVWTQAGHSFTGRLQGVTGELGDGLILLEREKDCLRIRRAFVYAVAAGGGK